MDSFKNLLEVIQENTFPLELSESKDQDDSQFFQEFHEEIRMVKGGRGYILRVYLNELIPLDHIALYVINHEDLDVLSFADDLLLTFGGLIDFIDMRERRKRRGQAIRWFATLGYKSNLLH